MGNTHRIRDHRLGFACPSNAPQRMFTMSHRRNRRLRAVIIHRTEGEYRRGRRTRRLSRSAPLPRTSHPAHEPHTGHECIQHGCERRAGAGLGAGRRANHDAGRRSLQPDDPRAGRSPYAAILTSVQNRRTISTVFWRRPSMSRSPPPTRARGSSVISDLRNDDISVIYPTPDRDDPAEPDQRFRLPLGRVDALQPLRLRLRS